MYNEIETFVQNHAFIRNLLTRPIFMQNFERNRHPSKFRKTFCAMMAYPNGTIPAANYSALPRVRRHPRPDEPLSLSLPRDSHRPHHVRIWSGYSGVPAGPSRSGCYDGLAFLRFAARPSNPAPPCPAPRRPAALRRLDGGRWRAEGGWGVVYFLLHGFTA